MLLALRMASSRTRRQFLVLSAGSAVVAISARGQASSPTHASVAELDRANIVAAASLALPLPVQPPPAPIFRSEVEPTLATAGQASQPRLQRAHASALRDFSALVAALTAGYLVTREEAYAQRALLHAKAWLVTPETRLQPSFDEAGLAPGTTTATPAGVVDLVPLAELARALSFLTDLLSDEDITTVQTWFADLLHWLNNNRQAFIARESKDHRASAWLLVAAGAARFARDEKTLEDCRKRFRSHTLRNQIRPDGVFPQEVATPNPYRNTLFNFDLLAGACQLLNSPFDPLWNFQLIDEVGLRSAAAYLYPVIAHPERWAYPADAQHFRDLPGRRAGLLFAGRAYDRQEYVQLWLSQSPLPPAAVAESFPIRQPALWTARAPHGL